MDRRTFLNLGGMTCLASAMPKTLFASQTSTPFILTAKVTQSNILGSSYPDTNVWSFNAGIPGPVLRIPLGQDVDVSIENRLSVPTSVHWHGIRLPNAMDGVAGLTQKAVLPGASFRYTFTPPDAGTFWYHSHMNASEQVDRGLYGPLIIEEQNPPEVDRDLVWMIDDWRLLEDGSISDDFGAGHDWSHAGRIGNVPTINGRNGESVRVRTGERLRLRLINAANARTFALDFQTLNPQVIAIDGQPVTPYQPTGPIVIGAAGRVDIILDMIASPESESSVLDSAYRDSRWVDSPLLLPEQQMELAFVADNPGNWLFHCHALEHHAAGLGALVRIT